MIPTSPEQSATASGRGPRPNPIYRHLTRNRRWPSASAAVLIGLGSTFVCSTLICMLSFLPENSRTSIPILYADLSFGQLIFFLIILGSLLLALVSPAISGVITAITTANAADEEIFVLIQLTRVRPRTIVSGYLLAALFRLRWLWILCYGLLLPLFAAIVLLLTQSSGPLDAAETLVEGWSDGTSIFFWIVFCGAALGTGLNWMTVTGGVWVGLAFKKLAPALGLVLGIILFGWIGLVAAIYMGVSVTIETSSGSVNGVIFAFVFILLMVSMMFGAGGFFFLWLTYEGQSHP
jgi:hypothetical protein